MKYKISSFRTGLALFKLSLSRKPLNEFDLEKISKLVSADVFKSCVNFLSTNNANILAVKCIRSDASAHSPKPKSIGETASITQAKKNAKAEANRQTEIAKTKAQLTLEFETFSDSVYAYIYSVCAKVATLIGKSEGSVELKNPLNNFDLSKFINTEEVLNHV